MTENSEEKSLSKGEQTRVALIEAAYSLFLEKGYHGTSMRQIAERANLALGGIYNHFSSKEDIFTAVFDAYHPYRRVVPKLQEVEGDSVEELVRDSAYRIKAEVEGVEHKIVSLMFIELVEFQGRHMAQRVEALLPTMLAFVQKFSTRRGKLRNVPLPIMLRTLLVTLIGYVMSGLVLKRVPAIEAMDLDWFDGMLDIYLHGILEREAE